MTSRAYARGSPIGETTMRGGLLVGVLFTICIGSGISLAEERPFGMAKRVPWTTSRVKGTPDPGSPYRTQRAFPRLKFQEPLEMAVAPGSGRLFIAERYGKILSFPNDPQVEQADLFLDLG